jgi:hypothetical protein
MRGKIHLRRGKGAEFMDADFAEILYEGPCDIGANRAQTGCALCKSYLRFWQWGGGSRQLDREVLLEIARSCRQSPRADDRLLDD